MLGAADELLLFAEREKAVRLAATVPGVRVENACVPLSGCRLLSRPELVDDVAVRGACVITMSDSEDDSVLVAAVRVSSAAWTNPTFMAMLRALMASQADVSEASWLRVRNAGLVHDDLAALGGSECIQLPDGDFDLHARALAVSRALRHCISEPVEFSAMLSARQCSVFRRMYPFTTHSPDISENIAELRDFIAERLEFLGYYRATSWVSGGADGDTESASLGAVASTFSFCSFGSRLLAAVRRFGEESAERDPSSLRHDRRVTPEVVDAIRARVEHVQRMLQQLGYPASSSLVQLRNSVRLFQEQFRIEPTGICDAELQQHLESAVQSFEVSLPRHLDDVTLYSVARETYVRTREIDARLRAASAKCASLMIERERQFAMLQQSLGAASKAMRPATQCATLANHANVTLQRARMRAQQNVATVREAAQWIAGTRQQSAQLQARVDEHLDALAQVHLRRLKNSFVARAARYPVVVAEFLMGHRDGVLTVTLALLIALVYTLLL